MANSVLNLPTTVAACASIAASLWVTGCFHEDGLADAADGIGGGWTRQQILRIMTDTRLGTYGSAALMLYIVTKLQLLGGLGTSEYAWMASSGAGPALLTSNCMARCTAPFLKHTRDYVAEVGPKSQFYSFMVQAKYLVSRERVLFALMTSLVVASCLYGPTIAVTLLLVVLLFAEACGSYGTHVLGGVMGDFLGATICVTELVILTSILSWQEISKLELETYSIWEIRREQGAMDVFGHLFQGGPAGVTLRFIGMLALLKLWCNCVGYRSGYVQEVTSSKSQTGDETTDSSTASSGTEREDMGLTFEERYNTAQEYLDSLAKPMGSLGTWEDWAARLSALQGTKTPKLGKATCLIFAADHGVAKSTEDGGESCSAYPSVVTQSILQGLERQAGGASVVGAQNNVQVQVLDVGVGGNFRAADDSKNVIVKSAPNKLVDGTKNFCNEASMSMDECKRCIQIGRDAVIQSIASSKGDDNDKLPVFALGEVGIGNTTSSAALLSALLNVDPKQACGGGATLGRTADPAVISNKVRIVTQALKLHRSNVIQPFQKRQDESSSLAGSAKTMDDGGNPFTLNVLAALGGAEIAAMVGCILEASDRECFHHRGIPIVVDGYIVTTAALVATLLEPRCCRVLFLATKSAEMGQVRALEGIQSIARERGMIVPPTPVLDMKLRLGEGTGAIMAVPILRTAAALMTQMATLKSILES